ncbi:MAG: RagB/SusD family nutrient uptake outer membrane protein [Saprospiraceae bacterium]|nr:RagB/SusD family nutrient uptake outer membrane protein [Saprospiraceae bacterium]
MKNLIYFLGLTILLGITSCSEDELDLNPVDSGSVDGFFTSTSDLVAGVNGIYNAFTGDWWGGAFVHVQPHFEAATENAIICCSWEYQYKQIAQGTMNSATGGVIRFKWDYGYQAIFRINSILEVLRSGTIEDLTPEISQQIEGELRFLRAYVYHHLTFLYGDVPLVQSVLTPDEARSIERTDKSTVETFMFADLDFAIANLNEQPFQGEFGRPTKVAAMTLKGQALMYRNQFGDAANTLAQVMALEGSAVQLDSDYESLFRGANEQSPEIIWSLQYVDNEVGDGEGNFLAAHYGPNQLDGTSASQGGGWGSFQYTQALLDEYYMTDGLPSDQSPLYDANNPFANRDSRFEGTFFFPGTVYRGTVLTENNFLSNGAEKTIKIASRKWKTETSNNSFSNNGAADFVLLRYADVLLMYAEAINETAGPNSEAYDAINKVRARANMPPIAEGLSQDQMREEIKHEREVEFFLEGTRYFDLLRWRDAQDVLLQVTEETRSFDPSKHYLWPVPQFAIDQSPNISQNPGY